MSQTIDRRFSPKVFCLFGFLAMGLGGMAGCGNSAAEPASSESNKPNVDNNEDAGRTSTDITSIKPAADSPALPEKPPTLPAASFNLDSTKIPDDHDEILALIGQIQNMRIDAQGDEEWIAKAQASREKIIEAADKVLAKSTDQTQRERAGQAKLEALLNMVEPKIEGIEERILEFCAQLRKEDSPTLALNGRLLPILIAVGHFAAENEGEFAEIKKDIESLMVDYPGDQELFGQFQYVIDTLLDPKRELPREAGELMIAVGNGYAGAPNPQLAQVARGMRDQGRIYLLDAKYDIRPKFDAVFKGAPESEEALLSVIDKVLANEKLDGVLSGFVLQMAGVFELGQDPASAVTAFEAVGEAFQDHENQDLAQRVAVQTENGKRRAGLIGQTLTLDGITLDGKPLDWNQFQDKVVLVFYWATTNKICYDEMRNNIVPAFDRLHDKGLDVVNIAVDDDPAAVRKFLEGQQLPGAVVMTASQEQTGLQSDLAVRCGVETVPFALLLDRAGKVHAIHTVGLKLNSELAKLFPDETQPADNVIPGTPSESVAPPTPAQPESGDGAESSPQSYFDPATSEMVHFVALEGDEEDEAADDSDAPEINPYLAPQGLTQSQIVDFIFQMGGTPKTIQERPGFNDALIEVAERLLATEAEGTFWRIGVITKLKYLHKKASLEEDNKEADKQLIEYLASVKDVTDKRIAKEVQFLSLERKVIDAAEIPVEEVESLLAELKTYFAETRLDERHLRMASATVGAINRLDSEDEAKSDELAEVREKHFTEFGTLFAKSLDRDLKAYGNKIAKKPADGEGGTIASDLVGKPVEMAGTTITGAEFDWSAYRGKVVIVDFWATWCGPCRKAMPIVKEFYEKSKDRGFDVVGVSVDKDLDALHSYIEENKIPWANLSGEAAQAISTKYAIRALPTLLLIDRAGNVVAVSHSINALTGQAEKLLAEADPKPAEETPDAPEKPADE